MMCRIYRYINSVIVAVLLLSIATMKVLYCEEVNEAKRIAEELARKKQMEREETQILLRGRTQLGIEYYKKGNYYEAVKQLELALKLDPTYKEAKSYLNKARNRLYETSRQHYDKGIDYYNDSKFSKAIEEFSKISPGCPYYEKAQQYKKAAERFLAGSERPDISSPVISKKHVKEEIRRLDDEERLVLLRKRAQEKRMMLDVEREYLPPERLKEKKEEAKETAEEIAERKEQMRQRKLIAKMNENMVPALSLTDANIGDVIREIMKMTGVTIVLDEGALRRVSGGEPIKVSFTTVSPMPLLDLLDIALKTTDLTYKVEPNYIWISDEATLSKEKLITKTYKLKYGITKTRKVSLIEFAKEGGEEE